MTHGARLQQAPAVCHGYGRPRAKAIVMSNGGKISWTCSVFFLCDVADGYVM
jgi:hypothetical protein